VPRQEKISGAAADAECSLNYRVHNVFEGIAEPVCENFVCSVPTEKKYLEILRDPSISGPLDFVHPGCDATASNSVTRNYCGRAREVTLSLTR